MTFKQYIEEKRRKKRRKKRGNKRRMFGAPYVYPGWYGSMLGSGTVDGAGDIGFGGALALGSQLKI